MTSPFPGMDPYLESPVYWQDFDSTFIGAFREQIADALPGQDLVACTNPRPRLLAPPD